VVDFVTFRHTDLKNNVFFAEDALVKKKRDNPMSMPKIATLKRRWVMMMVRASEYKKNMHDIDVQMKQKVLCFACEKPSSLCPVMTDEPKKGV